ncbi:MAG TPA: acyl-CoA thioesterase [Flavobacteriia bacterium]|jgi:acyl-CoA thioester hydrolase|nr:acyl-CoA thioesterase [Flavobacteriia bacterium]
MNTKVPKNKVSFHYSLSVQAQHIDALNHVNNIVYLQWVQEVSEMHWDKLASKEIKERCIWVALRHEIDYLKPAFENDLLTIYTWIEDVKGVKSTRIVHVYCNDVLLTKSKTTWCLLDAQTLRPKRIDNTINAIFTKEN